MWISIFQICVSTSSLPVSCALPVRAILQNFIANMAASSPLSTPSTMLPMKRRREDSHDIRLEKNETSPIIEEGNSGKKKERKRTKKIGDGARDSGKKGGIDESIGKMDNRLLADFFARQAKRHGDELTALELNDIFVPGKK